MSDRLLKILKEMSEGNPQLEEVVKSILMPHEMQKRLEDGRRAALGFSADLVSKHGLSHREVVFVMGFAMVAYTYALHFGQRGKARDDLNNLLDTLMDAIDGTVGKAGLHGELSGLENAFRRGDLAGAKDAISRVKEAVDKHLGRSEGNG